MEGQAPAPVVGSYDIQFGGFDKLMPFRVREVLLVASPYDSFLLADDDALTELVFSEYLDLNLRYAPRVTRVPTAEEALRRIAGEPFDLIITMAQIGNLDVAAFAREVKRLRPEMPVILLCLNVTDFAELSDEDRDAVDRIFAWQGDARIFVALIKLVEDERNIDHDMALSSVQAILLIEDAVRIYSAYLPIIYAEVMKQTQRLLAEGINLTHKMLRMRARPKILLAHDYESGWALYRKYHTNLLGVITDIEFPRRARGEQDPQAGLIFARNVKAEVPDMPVLIQSSDAGQAAAAEAVGASFLEKSSPTLLKQLGDFMLDYLGFGDFVFRDALGREHGRAADVHGLVEKLRSVPDASIEFHANRNHFSKWLMARTEFEVAYHVRLQQVADFPDIGVLRRYLIDTLHRSLQKTKQGAIAQFDGRFFNADSPFVKIGRGSIGGKARGLAFVNFLLSREGVADRFPGVRITVPHTSVIATDAFDRFIEDNRLASFVREERSNAEVAQAFLAGRLPEPVMAGLRTLAARLQGPLAVRSSSLFEDSRSQPFAGVYKTYMLPNNDPDPRARLAQLARAVKLVYASTYCAEARAYLKLTTHLPDEEKMAVIVQRIVGRSHAGGSRFYPSFSGVLQSCNYYPVPPITAADPVANVALGLGAAIVEGYKCLRFSPNHPRRLHQFSSVKDTLDNSQRDFLALDATASAADLGYDYEPSMVWCDLEAAHADGTLGPLASTYSADNQAISDGTSRAGVRLVTFAPILKQREFPLCEILNFVAGLGRESMGSHVEIEFAVDLQPGEDGAREFAILQMRPMMSQWGGQQVVLDGVDPARVICESPRALGNGYIADVRDVVYVRPEGFNPARTRDIAAQIDAINHALQQEGRRYALIGPGRWGSADPWLGIPARWHQISGARVIVETSLPNYVIDPSYGTHFFHNVTSLGLGYFIVHPHKDAGRIRWDWLDAQPAQQETPLLRHVRLARPLDIRIDGREGRGLMLAPE